MTKDKISQFLNKVTNWASTQSDIQALALVGSYARNAATETSDVDLVLITANPNQYLQNSDWILQFGAVEKQQVEDYGLLTSIRVWYIDGREIEYGITDERWAAIPLDEGSRRVISDGMQVLFEQNHILSRHQ
ncbi:MAG: nucleotidyltransferase domain-containing protein [Anaerolineales bacterium]|nr:nucleotidyltransferase domain-containing protein [Anaerolineales bacterium]